MLLKPSYIFDRPRNEEEVKPVDEEKINPKLRQCYETKNQIAPFYDGRKFCVLPSDTLACQCGNAVKIVTTVSLEPQAEEDEDPEEEEDMKPIVKDCFKIIKTYEDDVDEILTFDVHVSSGMLLTAHKSNLLRLWDLKDESSEKVAVKTMKSLHSHPIIHLLFDSDQVKIENEDLDNEEVGEEVLEEVTADMDNLRWVTVSGSVLRVWELGGSQVSKSIQVDNIATIGYLKWHPGPMKRLYAAEAKIYIIDYVEERKQYELQRICEGHFSQVTGIEFFGNQMISGGRDSVLIFWDANTFEKKRTVEFPAPIEALIGCAGTDLYAALAPSDVRRYDVAKHQLSTTSMLAIGSEETVVSFKSQLSKGSSGTKFWMSTVGSSLYEIVPKMLTSGTAQVALEISKQFVGSLEEILAVAIWSDMRIAVANNTSIIRVYNVESGSCRFLRGHNDIVLTLSVQKDWLVSGSKDNQIFLWKDDSDTPQFKLQGHIASVSAVCFDPLRMLVYSASEDTFIKVWDREKCLQSCVAHAKEIHSIHTSPNGAMLLSSSRDKTAKVWDSENLSLLGTLKGHKKSVWDAKFSDWDQLVVTASADTTLKIWALPSFDCIKTLQGHLSSVLQAKFMNQGLQIVSCGSDGTMKTWDLRNSTCLSTFEISEDKVWALDAVPDGSLVVLGSSDSRLTVMVDVTEERYQEKLQQKNKRVEEDQRLTNFLRRGDWQHAIELALELDRPFTLLKVIREIPDISELEELVPTLEEDQRKQLLRYIQKWNTSGRTCTEAQTLLKILLSKCALNNISSLVEHQAMISYTQKHFSRVQKNLQNIALIKYLADS